MCVEGHYSTVLRRIYRIMPKSAASANKVDFPGGQLPGLPTAASLVWDTWSVLTNCLTVLH